MSTQPREYWVKGEVKGYCKYCHKTGLLKKTTLIPQKPKIRLEMGVFCPKCQKRSTIVRFVTAEEWEELKCQYYPHKDDVKNEAPNPTTQQPDQLSLI